MNRTTYAILFWIIALIGLFVLEPAVVTSGLLGAAVFTGFHYLDTFLHELGHLIAGRMVGYTIDHVRIGGRKPLFSLKLFGVPFIFSYGRGGSTVTKGDVIGSKRRFLFFVLGGVLSQLLVIVALYFILGFGSEKNYYLPLVFMLISLKTIVFNLYPTMHWHYDGFYPTDGLQVRRIWRAKEGMLL